MQARYELQLLLAYTLVFVRVQRCLEHVCSACRFLERVFQMRPCCGAPKRSMELGRHSADPALRGILSHVLEAPEVASQGLRSYCMYGRLAAAGMLTEASDEYGGGGRPAVAGARAAPRAVRHGGRRGESDEDSDFD